MGVVTYLAVHPLSMVCQGGMADSRGHLLLYISLYVFVVDLGRCGSGQESWHPCRCSQPGNSTYIYIFQICHAVIALFSR